MTVARGTLSEMDADRDPYVPTPPPGQHELPSDDGEPMDTPRHRSQMNLLLDTLGDAWSARDDYYAGGNMFVYFSELQTKGEKVRGPDVYVVLDTERWKLRKSWVVWEEGGRLPNVVIELLSPSTERTDRGEKMRLYARVWRTGEYYLYDPWDHRLEGYRLDAASGEYRAIEPDARGDLPVLQMGLALGVREGRYDGERIPWLRWIDPRGEVLPEAHEREEAERARADAEQARADAERARADAERARAQEAERRIAELEARLRSGG